MREEGGGWREEGGGRGKREHGGRKQMKKVVENIESSSVRDLAELVLV